MILDRILPRGRLGVRRGPYKLSETPGSLWGGRESSSGATVTETDAMSLSAIFAGVMLLSRVLGTLPLGVYRRTTMWGQSAREPATTNPATWVLGTEFNPEMSACIGRRVCEFYRLLWGNGYAQIAWDARGGVAALWPLEAWRVKPDRDEDGTLWYRVDGTRRVEAKDMLHVPLVSLDGVCGRSFIDYAFESLGMSISAQEFAARFFGNDASPGVVLEHPGTPKKEAREEFRESWNRTHQGSGNSRKTAVIWGGWKVNNGNMISPRDAQLLDERRFGVEEVARWLNIPPHLLRDLSRSTFSNIEHQGIDFVVYSVGLSLTEWEQEYDRKLLDPPKVYCKHNVNALLRGDHAARSAFYHSLLGDGVLNVNEVRELEDLNPIQGGDVHYRPLNMTPVRAAAGPAPAPEPEPTPQPDAVPTPTPTPEPAAAPPTEDPPADQVEAAAAGDVQASALNGAQMIALTTICDKLILREYPADGTDLLIEANFPLMDKTLIKSIVAKFAAHKPPPPATPPGPGPAPPPAPPGAGPELRRTLLEHTLARLGRVEANAVRRAAEKPAALFAWMDDFYPDHSAKLAEALAPVLAVCGVGGDARVAAGAWCAASREALLSAADGPPAGFPARLETTLAEWGDRPAAVAIEVLP